MIPISLPALPQISEAATEFFESILRPGFVVFEWGSGSSTVWLAERVASVVTVENLPEWEAEVMRHTAPLGNVEHMLVATATGRPDWQEGLERYVAAIEGYPDGHFDIVFSDGLDESRTPCPGAALPKVRPGGWLVVDDVGWNPARYGADLARAAGWAETTRSGKTYGAWDGHGRDNVTAFFRRPARQ